MGNGYILLWRKFLDSLVWQDVKLWRLWAWCLLRAFWKERTVAEGRNPILLRPGDLAAPLAEISAGAGLSRKEVRSCLCLGKRTGCMAVRGTARGTPIRFVNWQDCRRPGAGPDAPPGRSPDNRMGNRLDTKAGKRDVLPCLGFAPCE